MADNYIQVDPATNLGGKVWSLHEHIVAASNLASELTAEMAQAHADDNNDAKLATLLGATVNGANASADAGIVKDTVGSVNTDLQNGANHFLALISRIGTKT